MGSHRLPTHRRGAHRNFFPLSLNSNFSHTYLIWHAMQLRVVQSVVHEAIVLLYVYDFLSVVLIQKYACVYTSTTSSNSVGFFVCCTCVQHTKVRACFIRMSGYCRPFIGYCRIRILSSFHRKGLFTLSTVHDSNNELCKTILQKKIWHRTKVRVRSKVR